MEGRLTSLYSRWNHLFASSYKHIRKSSGCMLRTSTRRKHDDFRSKLEKGPNFKDFIKGSSIGSKHVETAQQSIPYLSDSAFYGWDRKVYFEVYGCQMNVNDTEVVWSILKNSGYKKTEDITDADVVLLITCSIRDGAEGKIWTRLHQIKSMKRKHKCQHDLKVGLLGCMAERLKHKILEENKVVDIIAGPDSYRDLPRLLSLTDNDQTAVNVLLSLDETYADIVPVRLNQDSVTAFVSIMRGCDNMCTYCIVPFTRGRERSRPMTSILDEVKSLSDQGIKEITLLGQNVNSYRDTSQSTHFMAPVTREETNLAKGFKTVYKPKKGGLRFSHLLDEVSKIDPEMRIRFTSPHPKDFPDEVLYLIRERNNICCNLHIPAQSGSSTVLDRMRRGYTRESYIELIQNVKSILPDATLSSDFICGFCGETEEEFSETVSLMQSIHYTNAFIFAYSMREKTTAHRRFTDDIHQKVKTRRVTELNRIFRENAKKLNESQIGQYQLVLVEGVSKRSKEHLFGRNDGNVKVLIPANEVQVSSCSQHTAQIRPGDYVVVMINAANSQVLKGIPLYHSSISDFSLSHPTRTISEDEIYTSSAL